MFPVNKIRDIVEVMGELGVELKKRGNNYIGLCPFHEDKKPSLSVNQEKGMWHCFGCGAKGGVIGFVAKKLEISRFKAGMWLAGKNIETETIEKKIMATKQVEQPINRIDLLNNVARFYHENLKKNEAAKKYLNSRGLFDEGLFEKFKIGFADGSIFKKIPVDNNVKATLKEIGIINQYDKEFFNNYVVFPIFDTDGNCVKMYGRLIELQMIDDRTETAFPIDDSHNSKTKHQQNVRPPHLYLPGKHRGVWNYEAFTRHKEIILTESIIDALTLYQMNYTEVVPIYGTNGLTDEHLKFFETYQPEKVILALDTDESGNRASAEIAEKLGKFNIQCFRLLLPDSKDINEYINEKKHTKDEFDKLLEEIKPIAIKLSGSGNVFVTNDLIEFIFDNRRYQVREIAENEYKLKVNIRAMQMIDDRTKPAVSIDDSKDSDTKHNAQNAKFHVDVIDLYVHKTRQTYINACAKIFGITAEIIEKDICSVIEYLEKIKVKKEIKSTEESEKVYEMTQDEEEKAVEFLKSPDLFEKIIEHLTVCGYVGEAINKKIGYLITISRKLENPLSGVIISNSGAGKSMLMDQLAAFVPEEDIIVYTRITPQALYYKEERSLKNKLLITSEQEGLFGANYSIRELISSKILRMAAPVKDPFTGKMKTVEYEVEGPISLLFSTTSVEMNFENSTRCFTLSLDESREQTKKIHQTQRERKTLDGIKLKQDSEQIKQLHKNCQRLLQQLVIVNPYANDLSFPDFILHTRREQDKYLSLIEAIAFLHQYQREIKTMEYQGQKIKYIEIAIDDIEKANDLMIEILGQSLSELKKPSRELLLLIKKMVDEYCEKKNIRQIDFKFNRRDIREYTDWSDYQIKVHIKQLEELQYLLVAHGKRGKMFQYELAYDNAENNKKIVIGLTDTKKLREKYNK